MKKLMLLAVLLAGMILVQGCGGLMSRWNVYSVKQHDLSLHNVRPTPPMENGNWR